MSTENKNDIKILSDEDLNQVSGGAPLANGNPLAKPAAHGQITFGAKAACTRAHMDARVLMSTIKAGE